MIAAHFLPEIGVESAARYAATDGIEMTIIALPMMDLIRLHGSPKNMNLWTRSYPPKPYRRRSNDQRDRCRSRLKISSGIWDITHVVIQIEHELKW